MLKENQDELAKIEQLHETDMKASKVQDFDILLSLWTDDGVLLPPNEPPIIGKKAVAEMMKKQQEASKDYKLIEYVHEFKEIKIIGDWAFEWGYYRGTAVPIAGGEPIRESGKLMRILKREYDGSWKAARAIYTVDRF